MPITPKYFQIQLPMSPANPHPSSPPSSPKPNPKPLLRLELRDLSTRGTSLFLTHIDPTADLSYAVSTVLSHLYTSSSTIPATRSITLVLRPMPGVAYTTGSDLDNDHKQIHLSADYVTSIKSDRLRDELLGVLVHETVHCYQHNARASCPGGLIEGIADWVRLRAGYAPPHWKREASGDWDGGYQHTGYFLEYLEETFGEGSVRSVNEALREKKYEEDVFWTGLFGKGVKELWREYGEQLKKDLEGKEEGEAPKAVPTHVPGQADVTPAAKP